MTCIRRHPHLAWRRVVDEYMVLQLDSRMVYGVNESCALLLERLAEPRALVDLAAEGDESSFTAALATLIEARLLEETSGEDARTGAAETPSPLPELPRIVWSEPLPSLALASPVIPRVGIPACR